jgi:hypothetical protein
VISAIGIVPAAFYLSRRDKNVLPVFPASGVDVAANVLHFGRVAVRVIAKLTEGLSGMCHVE